MDDGSIYEYHGGTFVNGISGDGGNAGIDNFDCGEENLIYIPGTTEIIFKSKLAYMDFISDNQITNNLVEQDILKLKFSKDYGLNRSYPDTSIQVLSPYIVIIEKIL